MRKIAILTLAVGTLALAACGSKEPEQPVIENNEAAETPEDLTPPNETLPDVNVTNEVAPAAPPPAFSDDEQMRDDADATGLTSRLPQNETEAPVSNEAAARQ
jgi:hypothetical protein